MPFLPPNQQRQSTEGIDAPVNKAKNAIVDADALGEGGFDEQARGTADKIIG